MLKQTAGDTLRHARWRKGWTIEQESDVSGVSIPTIVKIEKGNRNVNGQKVYALAEALELDPAPLFEEAAEASA